MQTEFSFDLGPILLIEKITLVAWTPEPLNKRKYFLDNPAQKRTGYGFRNEILQGYGSLLYLCKPAKKGDDYKGLD